LIFHLREGKKSADAKFHHENNWFWCQQVQFNNENFIDVFFALEIAKKKIKLWREFCFWFGFVVIGEFQRRLFYWFIYIIGTFLGVLVWKISCKNALFW
jgi:hypothetical protein